MFILYYERWIRQKKSLPPVQILNVQSKGIFNREGQYPPAIGG
jgi:hypothetical protein